MKPPGQNRFHSFILGLSLATPLAAADLYWDANGGTGGTGGAGTWTNANTWRDGSATGTLGNWIDGNNAIFGSSAATVTIPSEVQVNQLKSLTTNYTLGAVGAGPIRFTGTYSDSTPTIDTTGIPLANARNLTISAKITGTLDGGLVIRDPNPMTAPQTTGRLYLNPAAGNDFVGDVTVLSGNLQILSGLGASSNKLILKGGALHYSTGAGTLSTTFEREIQVSADSGFVTHSASGGLQTTTYTGKISGSGNLTRYGFLGGAAATSTIVLKGDLSGYTGTIENVAVNVANGASLSNNFITIETTATSAGAWKLSGGTLRLNTTNDTHIANGTGKSNLLMNGGTLDMNGKSETINGLDGATGSVGNTLAASTSTLTLGDGNASASFGGTIVDGAGTVAITKIGNGTQTLAGISSYTGNTLVSAGTLLVIGQLGATAVTVAGSAALGGGGLIAGSVHFDSGANFVFNPTDALTINGTDVTFGGFGVANVLGLSGSTENGTYTLIDGTANVSTTNLLNVGFENRTAIGTGREAYFETRSLILNVIPEPSTALLGGLGLLALLRRRRD